MYVHLPQGERLSSLRERIQKLLDVPEKDMDKVCMHKIFVTGQYVIRSYSQLLVIVF